MRDHSLPPSPLISPVSAGWPSFTDANSSAIQRSPDGRYLAFVADIATDNDDDLWVVDLQGSSQEGVNVSMVPAGRDVEQFEWSPDTFVAAGDEAVDGEIQALLFNTAMPGTSTVLNAPFVNTSSPDFDAFSWTLNGDGTALIARGDWQTSFTDEAVMMPFATPGTQVPLHPTLSSAQDVFRVLGEL